MPRSAGKIVILKERSKAQMPKSKCQIKSKI
jgi:hypothetical protein